MGPRVIGFVVVNPEVLVLRRLARIGRPAPSSEFVRWRMAQLRLEVAAEAAFWDISPRDVARSMAAELAEARAFVGYGIHVPVSARSADAAQRQSGR